LLAALAVAAAWLVAPKLHRFAYWIDRKTPAEVAALARGRWQVDELAVGDGVTLRGLVRAPAAPNGRWVLFVPGNSTALLGGFQQELERALPDDLGVAFWAYRGFEASDGVPTPAALLGDLLRQWDVVAARNTSGQPAQVFGYSLGSVLAVQLAAALTHKGQPPGRLVLAAAGERIPVMQHGAFGRFLPDDVYDATAAADAVECPVVIVQGTADDALPLAGARALRDRIGHNASLVEAEGKGHTDVWETVKAAAFR
ncbi:MAG: alpha/beta hydrolase, partial [Planctomycetes bacterium]|nr:alpha/beta hydrolase [Planctomycetota bacterium]